MSFSDVKRKATLRMEAYGEEAVVRQCRTTEHKSESSAGALQQWKQDLREELISENLGRRGSVVSLCSSPAALTHFDRMYVWISMPWEDAVDEAYERKKLRYAQLAAQVEQRGWRVQVYRVEVGCQGFVAHSTTRFLRDIVFSGQEL
ncbi:UNVERIFIED_CONTAM: hypothetical protein FKN15_019883 [Acipenser sinensis]